MNTMHTIRTTLILLSLHLQSGYIGAIHIFNVTRDYLDVTSENYPGMYPRGQDSWVWTARDGYWGILFLDFSLACQDSTNDKLVVQDMVSNKKLYYFCDTKPPRMAFYRKFNMTLHAIYANEPRDQSTQGFRCQVFFGRSEDEVNSKIDRALIKQDKDDPDSSADNTNLFIILIIGILVLVVVICLVVGLVILRRYKQTTNTSVHLNIGAIRHESAVSYTRHGNGPVGPRSRFNSEESTAGDNGTTRPKRPVKRSASNASWAMRAEMTSPLRNGSSSSDGNHSNPAEANFYSLFPSDIPSMVECSGEKKAADTGKSRADNGKLNKNQDGDHDESDDVFAACVDCRLSSISEESRSSISTTKVKATLPVPFSEQMAAYGLDNSGYMIMTSCTANYTNVHHL